MVLCVPNFSEGRRVAVIDEIASQIRSVPETLFLGQEFETDHNRAVFTFAGPSQAVLESAIRAAICASERIDLNGHEGVHPRIGAVDVVPFVPLGETSMDECVSLAVGMAHGIWERAGVPSYLYEFAARTPERRNLEFIRKRGFEGLRSSAELPDVGGPGLHPSAGACAIGARRILLAVNINLSSGDIGLAKRIAQSIRTSSGGFPFVKALGLMLHSTAKAQVSMNLTNYEVTSLATVYQFVKRMAEIHSTEIIGFPPLATLAGCEEFLSLCLNWHQGRILENAIAECSSSRAK